MGSDTAPGDGAVDWLGVMQALKDIGFASRKPIPTRWHAGRLHLKGLEKQLA